MPLDNSLNLSSKDESISTPRVISKYFRESIESDLTDRTLIWKIMDDLEKERLNKLAWYKETMDDLLNERKKWLDMQKNRNTILNDWYQST